MEQQVRFCASADGTRIAYATYGERGQRPILSMHVWTVVQGIEWGNPEGRVYYEELASDRQVISFDRRGIGASQREVDDIGLAAQVADLAAVVDDARLDTFDIAGFADGAAVAAAYAARHPARVSKLALSAVYSHGEATARPDQTRSIATLIRENWPLARRTLAALFPVENDSIEARRRFSAALRESVSAEVAARYIEGHNSLDVRKELAEVRAPTLILQSRRAGMDWGAAAVAVAALIPGARLVTLEEEGFIVLARTLRRFFDEDTSDKRVGELPSGTAVILFADIADSTALTERLGDAAFRDKARDLDTALRRAITDAGGTAIEGKLLGDGVLAVFTSAREAIACAQACHAAADGAGLALHAGIHAGDVIREEGNVYGGAVNIAARIADASAPGEVLVSQTVRDLARTSAGVSFEDRGERELKGVGEPVRVWAVRGGE